MTYDLVLISGHDTEPLFVFAGSGQLHGSWCVIVCKVSADHDIHPFISCTTVMSKFTLELAQSHTD